MKCKNKCLLCKHSKTGEKCNKDLTFKEASSRDISDRLIVYKLRLDYLRQDFEKAKLESSADYYRKAIKETEGTIDTLNKALFSNNIKAKSIETDTRFKMDRIIIS